MVMRRPHDVFDIDEKSKKEKEIALKKQVEARVIKRLSTLGYKANHIMILMEPRNLLNNSLEIIVDCTSADEQFSTKTEGIKAGLKAIIEARWQDTLKLMDSFHAKEEDLKEEMKGRIKRAIQSELYNTPGVDFFHYFSRVQKSVKSKILESLKQYHLDEESLEINLVPENNDLQTFLLDLKREQLELSFKTYSFQSNDTGEWIEVKVGYSVKGPNEKSECFYEFYNKSKLGKEKFLEQLKYRLTDLMRTEFKMQPGQVLKIRNPRERQLLVTKLAQPIASLIGKEFGIELRITNLDRDKTKTEILENQKDQNTKRIGEQIVHANTDQKIAELHDEIIELEGQITDTEAQIDDGFNDSEDAQAELKRLVKVIENKKKQLSDILGSNPYERRKSASFSNEFQEPLFLSGELDPPLSLKEGGSENKSNPLRKEEAGKEKDERSTSDFIVDIDLEEVEEYPNGDES